MASWLAQRFGEAVVWGQHLDPAQFHSIDHVPKIQSLAAVLRAPVTAHLPVVALTRGDGHRWTAEMMLAALSQGREARSWAASMEPAELRSLALVHPACARWVQALLRSQAMEPVFQRLYAKIFRPSAILHPGLLQPRAELLALLDQTLSPRGLVSYEHLHMQHLAEVWAHFCNIQSTGCQWTGWMRLAFNPCLAPDGSWPGSGIDGHPWTHQSVVATIEDYLQHHIISAGTGTNLDLLRSFSCTQHWLTLRMPTTTRVSPFGPLALFGEPNLDPTQKLRRLLHKYAALFPQLSDEAAAVDVRLNADDFAGDAQHMAAVSYFCLLSTSQRLSHFPLLSPFLIYRTKPPPPLSPRLCTDPDAAFANGLFDFATLVDRVQRACF